MAYTGLADVYALQANTQDSEKRDALYEKARTAASKALQIDETLAEAHTSLGWIKRTHDWDWAGAEGEFRRAIELNPNYVNAHQWYALLLTTQGRLDEALAEAERARDIDPVSSIVLQNYFTVHLFRRDVDQLPAIADQIAGLESDEYIKARVYSSAFFRQGEYAKSIEIDIKYAERNGGKLNNNALLASMAVAYARTGHQDKSSESLKLLENKSKADTASAFLLAMADSDFGRTDKAIALLERCFGSHDDRMVWIKVEPQFDPLRSDPKFRSIIANMNL